MENDTNDVFDFTNAAHYAAMSFVNNVRFVKCSLTDQEEKAVSLYSMMAGQFIEWLRDPNLQLSNFSFQPICSLWQEGFKIDKKRIEEFFLTEENHWEWEPEKDLLLYVCPYYMYDESSNRYLWESGRQILNVAPSLF